MIKGQEIELVNWEDVRRDNKYPIEDNNAGYIFGIEYVSEDDNPFPMDMEWFQTEQEMYTYINQNELKILKMHPRT